MKVIIAGSRDWLCVDTCRLAILLYEKEFGRIKEIVCGGARGADEIGRIIGKQQGISFLNGHQHSKT